MRTASEPDVRWRRLDAGLWSGTRDGRPVGTVERGRRYTAVGVEGEVLGRFDSLEAAMGALLEPRVQANRSRRMPVVVERTLFGVTSAFGLGAVAVIGYAIAAGLF